MTPLIERWLTKRHLNIWHISKMYTTSKLRIYRSFRPCLPQILDMVESSVLLHLTPRSICLNSNQIAAKTKNLQRPNLIFKWWRIIGNICLKYVHMQYWHSLDWLPTSEIQTNQKTVSLKYLETEKTISV